MPTANRSPYRALFEEAGPWVRLSADGRVEEANEAFLRAFGWSGEELKGKGLSLLAPRTELPQGLRAFDPGLALSPGRREDIAVRAKHAKDPAPCELETVRAPDGACFLGFRDLSPKRELERDLIERHRELRKALSDLERANAELRSTKDSLVLAGKLAALGELVAGVAHELNQPLQGIMGYTQEAIDSLAGGSSDSARESMAETLANARRMAEILRHFRDFTRKPIDTVEDVDLPGTMEGAMKLLSKQFQAHGITVRSVSEAGLPPVRANRVQLEQVFINLGANARDAIQATGRGEGTIEISFRRDGEFVELRFRDDGCGMTEETKSRVFDPFFTTKEVGEGMGIGLAISHGILRDLHAAVVVESEFGKFTEFRIRFPRAGAGAKTESERRSA